MLLRAVDRPGLLTGLGFGYSGGVEIGRGGE